MHKITKHRYYYLLVVSACWCHYYWAWGSFYGFLVFINTFKEMYSATLFQITWVNSIAVAMAHGLSLATGLFVARFSSQLAAIIGTFIYSAGFLASAYVDSLWELYLSYSILVGVGMALLGGPAQASIIALRVPQEYFGLCFASAFAAACVGAIVNPYLFQYLLETYSLKTTLFIISGTSFVTNLLSTLVLVPPDREYTVPNLSVLKQKKVIPLLVGLPILVVGYWMIFVFVTPYGKDILRMSEIEASYLLVTLGSTNFVGRIANGYLSDTYGALPVFCYITFSMGVLTTFFPLIHDSTVFYIYLGFIGLYAGGVFGLLPKILVEYFGPKHLPIFYGLVFSVSAVGSVGGPPLIGAIVDSFGYLIGSISAGVFLFVGIAIISLINRFEKYSAVQY